MARKIAVKQHRVFMPPKMRPVPKGPVLHNFCTKITKGRRRPVNRKCQGGPWDGKAVMVGLHGGFSMVFRVGKLVGRYIKAPDGGLIWEDVDVSIN